MFSTQTYGEKSNWYARIRQLVRAGVPAFAYYTSNQDDEKSYLFVSTKGQRLSVDQLDGIHRPAFGRLGYDLKNQYEQLRSTGEKSFDWPDEEFWMADYWAEWDGNAWVEHGEMNVTEVTETIDEPEYLASEIEWQCDMDEAAYLETCKKVLNEIQMGNVYELNLCLNFYAKGRINPLDTFERLNALTEAPFAGIFQAEGRWVLSGSPERFLKRAGDRLLSQPIKGTAPRGRNAEEDRQLSEALQSDAKERAENVMIVDLVRNDLSRVSAPGTVEVDELCGVRHYKTVHQLVSTVSCVPRNNVTFGKVLRATFPMGSMTGAPKVSAMELIDRFECFQRGPYSGAIGYILPGGDMDFNVLIRTVFYDESTRSLSAPAGGAITSHSIPEKEYQECLLKARAMQQAVNG